MPAVVPDPRAIHAFASACAFEAWLARNHATKSELWLKIQTGCRSPSTGARCCSGFTPRRARSIWSQINRDNVARLIAAGRMTPHGLAQVFALAFRIGNIKTPARRIARFEAFVAMLARGETLYPRAAKKTARGRRCGRATLGMFGGVEPRPWQKAA